MQSLLFSLVDFIRGRWMSFKGEIICGTYAFKVAGLLALLIWHYPDDLRQTVTRLVTDHGMDRRAWEVMFYFGLTIGTVVFFEWMRRAYRIHRKQAEWRIPVIRLRRWTGKASPQLISRHPLR